MATKNNRNNNQNGLSGKTVGIAAAVGAGSGMTAFGAGYSGAAFYDMASEIEILPDELTIEENVPVEYDEPTEEVVAVEPIPEPEVEEPVKPGEINNVAVNVQPGNLQDIDPDVVTDEIIAAEMVDPNDIDSLTVVEFTSLGTHYDAHGNEVTVAYFHDNNSDTDMMLVDNNGDGTFDYVADTYGNYYADSVMGTVFTVDDVEAQISDGTYLAANTTPDSVLETGESYLDDMIII